jgi:hypothetical protein
VTLALSALIGALFILALAALRVRYASFVAQSPSDYDGKGPEFDLCRHLSGPIVSEGVIFGPTGRVVSRFVASMEGTWTGTSGTLAETFHYDSGSIQHRAWTLTLDDAGQIIATAPDVVGQGHGRATGSSVMLRYRIRLTPEAGGHVLDVTDWMYLMDNGTIMNRSQFRKFGIVVAELVATMRPAPEAATEAPLLAAE